MTRFGFIAIGSAFLLGLHCLASLYEMSLSHLAFFWTLVCLEVLEKLGLPTLTGSPSGWPLPTTFGWIVAGVGWFLIYFLVILLVVMIVTRLRRYRVARAA